MTDTPYADDFVRSVPMAVLCAIPAISLLGFYLWLGVAMLAGIAFGLTGSVIIGLVIAGLLGIPASVLSWRIVRSCVDAERRTP